MLRREHAGEDGVVASLDARHVDEPGRAADQRAARKCQLRHALPAALGDRPRAITDAPPPFEGPRIASMRLEALEFLERCEPGVAVVQVHDETDRHQVFIEVIQERAAASAHVERPAEGMLDQAGLVLGRVDFPQLLQADAELLRVASLVKREAADKVLGERAARAFGDQHVLAKERHAALIARSRLA